MVMKWAVIKPTENSNGYISRISVVRQFGKYLSMLGEEAFILPDGLKGGDMFVCIFFFTGCADLDDIQWSWLLEPGEYEDISLVGGRTDWSTNTGWKAEIT